MEGENGGAFGGFYHATDQNQVLSTKRTRLGTSHQVVLNLGKKSYFAFVEEAILVHGRDFFVFLIGNVCLRGQLLINLICT